MREPDSLEQRVDVLEREVAALKGQLPATEPKRDNWIEKITGTFEGDPEFAEIVRLGAEIRRRDRPADEDP
jgi:hypothetical protein